MPPHDPENLERLLHRALRDLPDRSAPPTLEHRVLGEIGRRAAARPRRLAYAQWSPLAKFAFFATAVAAAVAAAFVASGKLELLDAAARRFEWVAAASTLWQAGLETANAGLGLIPEDWVHFLLAAGVVAYAALALFGSAACRVFLSRRDPRRSIA